MVAETRSDSGRLFEWFVGGRPWDAPPGDVDAARAEAEEVFAAMRDIDTQLSAKKRERFHSPGERTAYEDWKARALAARRAYERRYRFLKQWIGANNIANARSAPTTRIRNSRLPDGWTSAGVALRHIARNVGQLESVFFAAGEWRDDPSEEKANELRERIEHARAATGDEER